MCLAHLNCEISCSWVHLGDWIYVLCNLDLCVHAEEKIDIRTQLEEGKGMESFQMLLNKNSDLP